MSIVLQGSTSGSITLQEPAVAGSNTLNLPAVTATLATEVNGALYPLTSGTAVASTSGTSIDFTSIPSWVKRITVNFAGVSTSGTSFVQIQLGTGGTPTYTTSGYLGSVTSSQTGTATANISAGFVTDNSSVGAAASIRHGSYVISNITGNTWICNGSLGLSNTTFVCVTAGSVPLGAALTAVRITTAGGTDTFDAGSINILYE
jgi:hypothetical protein